MCFPSLSQEWTATRDTLQSYCQVLGAIRGALTPPHPRWWHISLQATPSGLSTGPIELPAGALELALDLERHQLSTMLGGTQLPAMQLAESPTSAALGTRLRAELRAARVELPRDLNPKETADRRDYDGSAARTYLKALLATHSVFADLRQSLDGQVSPLQLWPHHFDLSFEWLGTRIVSHEEDGGEKEDPAQIGFGFSTGDASHPTAYYYATPWPFDQELLETRLPTGADWYTDQWQGARIPYSEVEAFGGALLRDSFERVFRAASPGLCA